MTTIGYTPLKGETQDDEVSEAQQIQGDLAFNWKFRQYALKVVVVSTVVICVAAICGWATSSVFSRRFAHSNSPGLLPEGFFPDCTYS